MRLVATTPVIRDYFDRQPLPVSGNYFADNVPPHAITDRLTYTVPAGRLALVRVVFMSMTRAVSPTTLGRARITLVVGTVPVSTLYMVDPGVWAHTSRTLTTEILLRSGDSISLRSEDTSTGGSVNYWASYHLTEFDAGV